MGSGKLLIVEDEVIFAMELRMRLVAAGFEAMRPVGSVKAAMAVIEAERPDSILLDINLAGEMDGLDVARFALALYSPRIIYMTGYPDSDLRERALGAGPSDYLEKPVDYG